MPIPRMWCVSWVGDRGKLICASRSPQPAKGWSRNKICSVDQIRLPRLPCGATRKLPKGDPGWEGNLSDLSWIMSQVQRLERGRVSLEMSKESFGLVLSKAEMLPNQQHIQKEDKAL
ncbi:hypothetical protein TSAR_005459 [Trichomalopsis sarcophagae]|uniref:Uncharacterized protein n=1 Tax=Trichomalopsis sarcophagae TaxID=543379 RepID=A0A232ER62_9HYME|nr:hypothetical protein TSAR_005459 [Trichomalopsis sarcophagae]